MRKSYSFILCTAALLLLCSCQPAPSQSSSRNNIATSGSAGAHDAQTQTEDSAAAYEVTIIPECSAHITEAIEGKKVTININADVIKPDSEALSYYTYQTADADKSRAENLIDALWQDKAAVEYDSATNRFDIMPDGDDTFSIELKIYQIRLIGHGANLNPYKSNIYAEQCEVLSEYTNSEAAELCREVFRKVCEYDSETLSIVPYGKAVGEKYCKITTAPLLDGLPVVDEHITNSFDVSDAGIYSAKLNGSRFDKQEHIEEIISLNDAVDILRKSVDKIMIFTSADESGLIGCTVNSEGAMTEINVNEIRLGYVLGSGNSATVYPAWIFAPGKSFSDYSHCFAVNAVNGEVTLP